MTESTIQDEPAPRVLSDAEALTVIDTVKRYCGQEGRLEIAVVSQWNGGQRWARNRASMTSDQRDIRVTIKRRVRDAETQVQSNQIDENSLRAASEFLNYNITKYAVSAWVGDMALEVPQWEAKGIPVWRDKTFNRTMIENGQTVRAITRRSEENGFFSAGYLETIGAHMTTYERDDWGREETRTAHVTQVQCSVTVRHPKSTGSGWAGGSSFDLERIDVAKIADLAFEKCLKSVDSVRIEPGRYQTILEPQAVAEFARLFVRYTGRILDGEKTPGYPLVLGYDQGLERMRSKLGLRIMDKRINMLHDPNDPIMGTHPQDAMRKVQIVQEGVLSSMYYEERYAITELDQHEYDMPRSSFTMSGTETTSIGEMIATMKRGLLVTRVSEPQILDKASLLCTGLTRDGLWLIENGKISKAVRNFRWTESPHFIFNNVDSIGISAPVFAPNRGRFLIGAKSFQNAVSTVVVPALKVNDFSFTSTIDAI